MFRVYRRVKLNLVPTPSMNHRHSKEYWSSLVGCEVDAAIFFFHELFLPSVQVMVAMELCTNGALREALKLNIDWPLKVLARCESSKVFVCRG